MKKGIYVIVTIFIACLAAFFAYQHYAVDKIALKQAKNEVRLLKAENDRLRSTGKGSQGASSTSDQKEVGRSTDNSTSTSTIQTDKSSQSTEQASQDNTASNSVKWIFVYAYDGSSPWIWAPDAAGAYECVWRHFNPDKDIDRDSFVEKAKTDVQQVDTQGYGVAYGYQVELNGNTYVLTLTDATYGGKPTTNAYKLYQVNE